MMIATSVYGIIDGIFVSNFAGKEAFTALNFISASADWKILHVSHIIAFRIHNLECVGSKKDTLVLYF